MILTRTVNVILKTVKEKLVTVMLIKLFMGGRLQIPIILKLLNSNSFTMPFRVSVFLVLQMSFNDKKGKNTNFLINF